MTDHVHEWKMSKGVYCTHCGRSLPHDQAEAMLNAAEQLSAEDALDVAYDLVHSRRHKLMLAYAKARGGE